MPVSMSRGKYQVLFNYLPGRTVEFERQGAIARISHIRGFRPREINPDMVIDRVVSEIRAWPEERRPALRDHSLVARHDTFELVVPESVSAELFPRVFWCSNPRCGRVFDHANSGRVPRRVCPECNTGELVQLRWVCVHHCGELLQLQPPRCRQCEAGVRRMALDTRGSEHIVQFRWVCRGCGAVQSVFGGYCSRCGGTGEDRQLRIQGQRAGMNYYPYTTTLLNIPRSHLDAVLRAEDERWSAFIAAKFLGIQEVEDLSLKDFGKSGGAIDGTPTEATIPASVLDSLVSDLQAGRISAEQMAQRMQELSRAASSGLQRLGTTEMTDAIQRHAGLAQAEYYEDRYGLLEAVLVTANATTTHHMADHASSPEVVAEAARIGVSDVCLLTDFPVITASYGYSRVEYGPGAATFNPFPMDQQSGKFPLFVDKVEADAVRVSLDRDRVLTWLSTNGVGATVPGGDDEEASRRAYFIKVFNGIPLRVTLTDSVPEARMCFLLLHTLSHMCVRQASLLSGLERTSLSEYLLPQSMEFLVYCSHRRGATIGALTALFEQCLPEWLQAVRQSRRCVYDPVCLSRSGNCHACTHLAETSCRFFNLNLSRSILFGGEDSMLGRITTGFFDMA